MVYLYVKLALSHDNKSASLPLKELYPSKSWMVSDAWDEKLIHKTNTNCLWIRILQIECKIK